MENKLFESYIHIYFISNSRGGGGLSILNSKEHYNKKINKIVKSGQLK